MIKIYCTAPHPVQPGKYYFFPLLEPFLCPNFMNDVAKTVTPDWLIHYSITDSAEAADVFILPFDVAWYVEQGNAREIEAMIDIAKRHGKPVWLFSGGDYGITWPGSYANTLRMAGHKRANLGNQFAMPPFIQDPLHFTNNQDWHPLEWTEVPSVGFCGQANKSLLNQAKDYARLVSKMSKKLVGHYPFDLQPFQSTSALRYSVLHHFENTAKIDTHFKRFSEYNAGSTNGEMKNASRLRYYQNILENQYTVCVRGAGNFSIRFYDCIASGRIPILVDTECILPLENLIDWDQNIVRVPAKPINKLGQKLIHEHQKIHGTVFANKQVLNRNLWLEKLTYNGFFSHFHLLPPNISFANLYAHA